MRPSVKSNGCRARPAIEEGGPGPGIPAAHLSKLFDRFYRLDRDRSRRTGGSGLGLAIARSLVHAHGGRITVDSQVGRGSTFTVVLPRAAAW